MKMGGTQGECITPLCHICKNVIIQDTIYNIERYNEGITSQPIAHYNSTKTKKISLPNTSYKKTPKPSASLSSIVFSVALVPTSVHQICV
jgi:hypothetical protein